MIKKLTTILAVLALCVGLSGPVSATNYDYNAQVYKLTNTNIGDPVLEEINDSIWVYVRTIDSDTSSTLYEFGDDSLTALTNPITPANFTKASTMCNGKVRFRSTESSHDIIVTHTSGGYSEIVNDFTPQMHKIVIDERPGVLHHGMFWTGTISSTTETDTGIDFNYDTVIRDVQVEIQTLDSGASCGIDVGLLSTESAGGTNAFMNDYPLTVTGYSMGTISYGGSKTSGLLQGSYYWKPHFIDGSEARSLVYAGCSSGNTIGVTMLHYWFMEVK